MNNDTLWTEIIITLVVAIAVTIALIPLAKKLAIKLNAIDYPSARRVNMLPIPRLGGVAMFGGLIAAIVLILLGAEYWGWINPFHLTDEDSINYFGVALGVLMMFLVGFIDDLKDLPPKKKLVGQIIASCIVAGSGLLLADIVNPFGPGFLELGIWAYPITVFYLVAFANIINLIDGLDGLASGITAISAACIFLFAFFSGKIDAALLCIIIVGVCLGFLTKNFHPASIFMGDSGALTLGFGLGIVSLVAVARSALVLSLVVPILAAGVPIIDTAFAIIRRKRQHHKIDEADKGHIHHQLMRAGFSQRKTVLIMWGWTAALSICALLIVFLDSNFRIPVIIFIAVLSGILIKKLHLLGSVLAHHFHPRGRFRKGDSLSEEKETNSPVKDDSE